MGPGVGSVGGLWPSIIVRKEVGCPFYGKWVTIFNKEDLKLPQAIF